MGTKTRAELKTMLKAKLQEDSYKYWAEAAVNEALDMAQLEVAFDTGAIESTFYRNVTASTGAYDFPAEYLWLKLVEWEKKVFPIVESSWLDDYDPEWRTNEGATPEFATVENGKLVLYPVPSATTTANELRVKIARRPDEFAGDSTAISVPDYCVDALIQYAAWWLWEDYDEAKANGKLRRYERLIKPYKRKLQWQTGPSARRTTKQMDLNTYRDSYGGGA